MIAYFFVFSYVTPEGFNFFYRLWIVNKLNVIDDEMIYEIPL